MAYILCIIKKRIFLDLNALFIFNLMNKALFFFFILIIQLFSFSSFSQINGVSFVAPAREIGSKEIKLPKTVINANYISIMPYGFIPEEGTEIQFNSESQWWGEKESGTVKTIQLAKAAGYKVMLKPHVWKRHGSYTGHHTYSKESNWKAFEESFSNYILHFAKIAEASKTEVFCVGTEWERFALQRPNFWFQLIKDVKQVYQGKVTYAANWDEYKRISFWKELDYIGVDAYFPLIDSKTPSAEDIISALAPYKKELKTLSEKVDKPIIFTEFGYRSRDKTAEKPWESDRAGEVNLTAQNSAYLGFFTTFWNEDFIAGGFLWKWFANYESVGGSQHNGFTPQNKPAEKIIKKWYSK
ncbi:MAG: glycoside hydrolase [Flavobacteriales bacterium]|nr:glycoside hydrolase [Flavobacteriales bacterium]